MNRDILRLAVPALGALAAEPAFLLIDAAFVGRLGAAPLAGLAVATAVLTTVVNLSVFLAYVTTASVSRLAGAGRRDEALLGGVAAMWLALGVGAVTAGLLAAGARPLAEALGATPAALPPAVTYLRISVLGLPGMLLVLAATGVLRGVQDVRTPLVVALAGAALNTLLNWVLIFPAGLGIAGSALGTAAAQTAMAAALALVVARGLRRAGVALHPSPRRVRAAFRASTPLLMRTVALRIYLLASVAWAGAAGTAALAAHAVASTVWAFLALVLDALAVAGQALTGEALGAGRADLARALARRLLWWGAGSGAVLGAVVALVAGWAPVLFTDDEQVRRLLTQVLWVVAPLQVVAGAVFALDGILIGAGDHRFLAWAGVATTAVFLAAGWVAAALGTGLVGLWVAIGVYTSARLATVWWRAGRPEWLVTGAATGGSRPGRGADH